jgi:hypothetical protein
LNKLVYDFHLIVRLSVFGGERLQDDSGQFCKLSGELCHKMRTTVEYDRFGDSINPPDAQNTNLPV